MGRLRDDVVCPTCKGREFQLRASVAVYMTFNADSHEIEAINLMDEDVDLRLAHVKCKPCNKVIEEPDALRVADAANTAGPKDWPKWKMGW